MAEYIERETAIYEIMSEPTDAHYPSWYADKMESISVADVAPVRHGHWILGTGENALQKGYRMCSQCGEIVKYAYTFYGEHNYCPNCGAKMNGEKKENK